MNQDLGTKQGCNLSDAARKELLNKQVCCYKMHEKSKKQIFIDDALSFLTLVFPDFKIVRSEFDIYPGESFIYVGDMKWIPKIQKRTEPHVIVSTTGEFDLTDRKQVIDLAYLHNGKKVPKYLEELIDEKTGWTDEQFWYNARQIWLTGDIPGKELVKNDLFIKIITNFNRPIEMTKAYLEALDRIGDDALKYIESSLLRFIKGAKTPNSSAKKGMLKLQQEFYYNYIQNVPQAIQNLLDNPIDNKELKYLDFLLDLCWPNRRKL